MNSLDNTRIKLTSELFSPAAMAHFEDELDMPVLKAGPDLYTFDGPVSWQIDVTNTGDAFLVTGTAEAKAKTACARCLEDAGFSLMGEIEGYFLIGGEDAAAPEDMDEDEFDVLPDDHVIDVHPLIVAALLLEIPLIPLCDDDCKGLCSTCGANLNEGPCGCAPGDDADFEMAKNPFAALAGFEFSDEDGKDASDR